jgi:hypothetical protein
MRRNSIPLVTGKALILSVTKGLPGKKKAGNTRVKKGIRTFLFPYRYTGVFIVEPDNEIISISQRYGLTRCH